METAAKRKRCTLRCPCPDCFFNSSPPIRWKGCSYASHSCSDGSKTVPSFSEIHPLISEQRLTIHQFHYSVQPHDAVTNHMRLIRTALQFQGIGGKIFAFEIKGADEIEVFPFSMSALWDCDLLIVHHSQGNPRLNEVLQLERPKAMIYHNITPPEFFRHDPFLASLSRLGRKQLDTLRTQVVCAFAVSEYNAKELESRGFEVQSVFPLIDIRTLLEKPFKNRDRAEKQILFVGRGTPHKNQAQLIQTFYYLQDFWKGSGRLTLVGRCDPIYEPYLKLLVRSLRLEGSVHFMGRLEDRELKKLYFEASAFVCMSRHEGFCIPVVEAMLAQIPVFAWGCPGVCETLGCSGVLLNSGLPHRMAAIIATTLDQASLVRAIVQKQNVRLKELAKVHNRERIVNLLLSVIDEFRLPYSKLPTFLPQGVQSPTQPGL